MNNGIVSSEEHEIDFSGFVAANTTPVPDILFDYLLSILTGSELKVLLYIIRRTWGFKKDSDAISLDQFQNGIKTRDGRVLDRGCGVSDRKTIIKALTALVTKKCITREFRKAVGGDNDITIFRINFKENVVGKSHHPFKEETQNVVGKSHHGGRKIPTEVVGKSHPQDTVQDTVKQDTEEEESVAPVEPTSPPAAPPNIPASSHSHAIPRNEQAATRTPSRPRPILAEKDPFEEQKRQDARTLEALPETQRAVVEAFRSKIAGYLPLTRDFLGEAKTLAGYGATPDEIERCYNWLSTIKHYQEQGISLHDIEFNFVSWRAKQSGKKPETVAGLMPATNTHRPWDEERDGAKAGVLHKRRTFATPVPHVVPSQVG